MRVRARRLSVLLPLVLSACAGARPATQVRSAAAARVSVGVLKAPTAAIVDGRSHLVYELLVANPDARSVRLSRLEVDTGAFGRVEYQDAQLSARWKLLTDVDADTLADLRATS